MANFCSNCGAKTRGKFCAGCGKKGVSVVSQSVNYWDAKEVDHGDGYSSNLKGALAVGENEIIFYRNKFLSGKSKAWRTIPIRGIKSIYRTPLFNIITIKYKKKPEKRGFWANLFNGRTIGYKISHWESFIQAVQKINPNIKIKT